MANELLLAIAFSSSIPLADSESGATRQKGHPCNLRLPDSNQHCRRLLEIK